MSIRASTLVLVLACCGPRSQPNAPSQPENEEATTQATPEAAAVRSEPWNVELSLRNAAFDTPGAPSAIVHAPPAFDPAAPLSLVVFLHGWSGCARVLAQSGSVACREGETARDGWGLAARFDEAGVNALFVVVQLAFMQRNGSAGRFEEPGRFGAFLREMLAALSSQIGSPPAELVRITLLAHSAAFETALAILARGQVPVAHVVLFDALYRGFIPFADWAAEDEDRRLVSLYTGDGRTARQNDLLAARALNALPETAVARDLDRPLAEQIAAHRVVIARSPAPHASVPAHHLPEILRALGLSRTSP